jgi:hypothetical protein
MSKVSHKFELCPPNNLTRSKKLQKVESQEVGEDGAKKVSHCGDDRIRQDNKKSGGNDWATKKFIKTGAKAHGILIRKASKNPGIFVSTVQSKPYHFGGPPSARNDDACFNEKQI